jgi:hypothetical protein
MVAEVEHHRGAAWVAKAVAYAEQLLGGPIDRTTGISLAHLARDVSKASRSEGITVKTLNPRLARLLESFHE